MPWEIGLYDYRARYYNPQIGRFLQTDPIGYADGINWYAYCGNNPIILVDPWGLGSQLATGSIGAPGFVGSMIPVYGSARSAINDFQEGRYIWGGVNVVLAATDLIGAKSLLTIGGKLVVKGGGKVVAAVTAKKAADSYVDDVLRAGGKATAPTTARTGKALAKVRREFEAIKPKAWMDEAVCNPQKYTPDQLARMKQGQTPIGKDGFPMEIHHKTPLAEGGSNTMDNFDFKTRTDHRLGGNYKTNHPNLP